MAGINFVILKINGIDVTDIPHEEAVQIFLKAPEPILVEVRRRLNDSQQQSIKKPSTPNHEISEKSKDQNSDLKTTILQPPLSSSSIPPPPLPLQLSDNDDNQNIRVIESPIKSIRTDNLLESSNTQTLVPSHTNIVQHQTKIFKNHNNDSCYNVTGTGSSSGSCCIYKGGVNMGGMGGIANVNGTSSTAAAAAVAVIENDKKNDEKEKTINSIANATATASSTSQNDTHPNNTNNSCCSKCYVSTAVQTDIFTSEFIFNSSSIDDQTNEDNIFEECLAPEIDIEEITLRKSVSNERLGLTVKYNSGNASGSDDTDTCTEVYISDIMPDSVAARDGRLRQGDQILQVNGRDVSNKEETESLIAENKNAVTLLVSRCLYTDDDFNESGEFYDDEEQQIAYENYAIEQQQFLVDNNHSLDNVSQEQTNTSSTKSSSSPKHTNTIIDKSQNPSYQQDELISILSSTDPLHHANIKAHLESVNNEIALLNTRVENMMLHKKSQNEYSSGNQNLNSVYRVPMDSITPPSVPLNESPTNRINSCTVDDEKISKYSRNRIIDSDTEHIYETIPESSESEPFYCSPYESSDQNLVEKWLETQQNSTLDRCNKKRIQQIKLTTQKNSIWQKTSTKSNSSGDDRENSSSAYNTGGSCNSNNQLTLELNSNDDPRDKDIMRSTLTLCPPQKSELDNKQIFQQEISDGCKQCQRQKKEKNSPKRIIPFVVPQQTFQIQPQQQQQQICSSYPHQNIQRSRSNEQTIGSNCSTLRANEDGSRVGKTFVSNTAQIPADTMYTNRANLHQTMLLQQKLFRQALLQQNQQSTTQVRTHFTAPNLSQYYFVSGQEVATVSSKPIDNDVKMEWKVKRRQDGTRYIVRRPTRNRILRDRAMKISEERNECTTEDDTISEIKTGRYWTKEERKKHIERAKERRHRQQLIILNKTNNLPFPSTISNINSGNNIGCTGLSSTPIRTPAINQQIQQPPPFQVISTKPPRQSSAKNQSHQESTTLHKKILKKKNKDETVETNKQIPGSSNSSGSKMTGLLSVTTV